MSTRHILTEDEIHTLLHSASTHQQPNFPANDQSTQEKNAPFSSTNPPNANADQMLNIIQSELRQIRQLVASRASLASASHGSPLKFKILERLTLQGFQPSACEKLLSGLTLASDEDTAWQQIVFSLETQLPISTENILDHQGIIALVGPTGSGKTTGIAKLATQCLLRHSAQDIGLITTDFYSVGGRDQLCTFGRILDIPVHRVNNSADLEETLAHLNSKRMILIDTPGISHRDHELADKLGFILHSPKPIKTILTLPATTHENLINEIIDAFNYTHLSGISITKIDEAPFLGHVLSSCIDYQLPIYSYTNGQHIPVNFSIATLEKILNFVIQKPLINLNSLNTKLESVQC